MYISYAKLWKSMDEKGLTKSDLMALTGLSSRVIAKLAKNETVTTETIAKLCAALSCDVGAIMECADENALSLYHYSRTFGKVIEESASLRQIGFIYHGRTYRICTTKRSATKATRIYCESDRTIYWEQHYMMGGLGTPSVVREVLVKPRRMPEETVIVVIKGKPGMIAGLDEGIWVSARNGRLLGSDDIFVMSETAFKLFSV